MGGVPALFPSCHVFGFTIYEAFGVVEEVGPSYSYVLGLSSCRLSAGLLSSLKFKVKSLKWEEFRRYSRVVTLSAERLSSCRVEN